MTDHQKGQDHDGILERPITPALTAEEWASFPDWSLSKLRPDAPMPLYYPGRHGIAAANLYGQPFGFTREDVEVLRAACDAYDPEEWTAKERAHLADIRRLAAKIAALIPPE